MLIFFVSENECSVISISRVCYNNGLQAGFALMKVKITSNAKMKKYAEIGPPCLVPLSSLKYRVVFYHH